MLIDMDSFVASRRGSRSVFTISRARLGSAEEVSFQRL